jgi:PD-(D/E)XK endonuclease
VGDRTQLAVMTALYAMGFGLYVPFGENTRSDLILESDRGLLRIQCNSASNRRRTTNIGACAGRATTRSAPSL